MTPAPVDERALEFWAWGLELQLVRAADTIRWLLVRVQPAPRG